MLQFVFGFATAGVLFVVLHLTVVRTALKSLEAKIKGRIS